MKVDLFHRYVVNLRFRRAQRLENRSRGLLCVIRDRRSRDDLSDFVQPATRVPVRMGRVLPWAGVAVRMFVRMGVPMFIRMLMVPGCFNQGGRGRVRRTLLRPVLLARHIFLALNPDVHLGR